MLTDNELIEIRNRAKLNDSRQIDPMAFARDIERAVLAKAREQDPIYMWRLEDDGWMDCTKEWFESDIASGYEKRIVYAHPLPAQEIPDKQYDIDLIHRAAKHLGAVMNEHPYCDHVQVVKHFADIRLKERSLSASPKP